MLQENGLFLQTNQTLVFFRSDNYDVELEWVGVLANSLSILLSKLDSWPSEIKLYSDRKFNATEIFSCYKLLFSVNIIKYKNKDWSISFNTIIIIL